MANFQNRNRIWINNTLKANAETLDILKLLKDIGIFKEKRKKRKPKSKEEEPEMEDTGDEFLTPPSGGGGAGGVSAVPPVSQVTQALQALKSGASDTAQQKYLLERAKEEAQLAIGQLRDARQQKLREQKEEFENFIPDVFPENPSVVSEPSQEFTRQGLNRVPIDILEKNISPKVGEEGQIEDTETEKMLEIQAPVQEEEEIIPAPRKKVINSASGKMAAYLEDKSTNTGEVIGPRPSPKATKNETYQYYRKVATYFGLEPYGSTMVKRPLTEVNQILGNQYDILTRKGIKI